MDHHHHNHHHHQQKPSAASAAHVQSPTQSLHSMHSHSQSQSQSHSMPHIHTHPHTPSHSPPRVKHLSYTPASASASDTPGGGVSSPRSPSSPGGPPGENMGMGMGMNTAGDGNVPGQGQGQGVVEEEEDLNIFVSDLLEQMTCKFENIGSSIMGRIDDMGDRIDQMEHSIGDLLVSQGLGEDSGTISAVTHTNTTITSSNAAVLGAGVIPSSGTGEGVGVGNTTLKHTDVLGIGLSSGDNTK